MIDCLNSQGTSDEANRPRSSYHYIAHQNDSNSLIKHFMSKLPINNVIVVALLLLCGYLFVKINRLEDEFRVFTNDVLYNSTKLYSYNRLWKNMLRDQYNVQKINKIRELAKKQQVFEEYPISKAQYLLSIKNYPLSYHNKSLVKDVQKYENEVNTRMENIYDYSLSQLPLCIISYSTNNSHSLRNQHSLISILNQDYENYKVVIFEDFSTDGSYFMLQQFVSDKGLQSKLILIKNHLKQRELKSIYNGVMNYCQQHDIIIVVKGDDQLLGSKVFKTINHFYHQNNISFTYSKGLKSWNDLRIEDSMAKEFTLEETLTSNYRNSENIPSLNLITFKVSLFKELQWTSLQQIEDSFWQSSIQSVLWEPMLERSCRRKQLIPQFFYLSYQGLENLDTKDTVVSKQDYSYVRFKKDPYICIEK